MIRILICAVWMLATAFNPGELQKLSKPLPVRAPRLLWRTEKADCALSKPVISKGTLFVGSCDGKFYALQTSTGKELWSYDVAGDAKPAGFNAMAFFYKDLVIAGTDGGCKGPGTGYLYAFEQRTGKIRWKLHADVASANFADFENTLVFGSRNGDWVSVNLDTGKSNWTFRAPSRSSTCGTVASVATDAESIVLLAFDGNLYGLQWNSGKKLWQKNAQLAVATELLSYKDVVYFGTSDGMIHGLKPADGEQLVQLLLPTPPAGGIAYSSEPIRGEEFECMFLLGAGNGHGVLIAVRDEFAAFLWSQMSAEPWTSGAPEPWKNAVLVGNGQGEIVAYRCFNGARQWTTKVDGFITNLSHDDSAVYIAVKSGALYVFKPPNTLSKER